jgi:hypothetical protein
VSSAGGPSGGRSEARPEVSAARLRRNPLVLGVAFAPFVATLVYALVAGIATDWTAFGIFLAPFGLIASALFAARMWKDDPWPRKLPGKLTVEGDTILWNDEPLARRDEIERVTHYRDVTSGTVVRLHRRNARDWKLVVKDAGAAREVLRVLGFGPERSTAKLVGKSRFSAIQGWLRLVAYVAIFGTVGVFAAAVESLTRTGPGAFFAAMAMVIPVLAVLHLPSTTVEIGADALAVRWLGRTRVIPLADVIDIETTTEVVHGKSRSVSHYGVIISIRGKRPIAIRFGNTPAEIGERNQLVERFREVRAALARGDEPIDTAFLVRGGRDVGAWIAALRSGSAPEGGMRRAPIPVERFWHIIEDASARAVDRAAAAVAVGRSATPEQRQRVRIAADQTVDPALRHAMERAIDEQAAEEAIAEALDAVEKAAR